MRILLVNPPIYDFSAFDFWLKPYGLLRVGGFLRGQADLHLFDFLDRNHPSLKEDAANLKRDDWGRGKFTSAVTDIPEPLKSVSRQFRRYGVDLQSFEDYLDQHGPFDISLIQTSMTYWYPGVKEVLESLADLSPDTRIVLGGNYATLCPDHAASLGPDLVIEGLNLEPLWAFLNLKPDLEQLPFWEGYTQLEAGVVKLSDGCPFSCTYCSVPRVYPQFKNRSQEEAVRSTELLFSRGVRNVVFYDDALLFRPEQILLPYLNSVGCLKVQSNFHTPNALNARLITPELASAMVNSGFRFFFLGFESSAYTWQKATGGKVYSHELERATQLLLDAGAEPDKILCYLIVGHPNSDTQDLEESLRFANRLGLRVMLSEFSPIPGTPDGERCRQWVDLDEPLLHNKAAFTHFYLGQERLREIKQLTNELNRSL